MAIVLKRTNLITDAATAPASPGPVALSGNNATKTRGRPFAKGNPGRPRGSKNKITVAAEALIDGQAEAIAQVAIDKALKGDGLMLKVLLDRIAGNRKTRSMHLPDLPEIKDATSLAEAFRVVTQAVKDGALDIEAAEAITRLLDAMGKAMNLASIEERLAKLEGHP